MIIQYPQANIIQYCSMLPRSYFQDRAYVDSQDSSRIKIQLLESYIQELETRILYLQQQLAYQCRDRVVRTSVESVEISQTLDLISVNQVLNSACLIKSQELEVVKESNRLLMDRLSSGKKDAIIQELLVTNRRLKTSSMQTKESLRSRVDLLAQNESLGAQLSVLRSQCRRMKDQLFDKRHIYSKFKLCLGQLQALQVKLQRLDSTQRSRSQSTHHK